MVTYFIERWDVVGGLSLRGPQFSRCMVTFEIQAGDGRMGARCWFFVPCVARGRPSGRAEERKNRAMLRVIDRDVSIIRCEYDTYAKNVKGDGTSERTERRIRYNVLLILYS